MLSLSQHASRELLSLPTFAVDVSQVWSRPFLMGASLPCRDSWYLVVQAWETAVFEVCWTGVSPSKNSRPVGAKR